MRIKTNIQLVVLAMCCAVLSAGHIALGESSFATEVVGYSTDLNGSGLYNDPSAVLGKPTTWFYDPFHGGFPPSPQNEHAKLVESAYNVGPAPENTKLLTSINNGSFITVKFDHRVENDSNNPFGIDLLVFGNQRYNIVGGDYVDNDTNMNTLILTGGSVYERAVISVSQDGITWYTYDSGPYAEDHMFPTQAYQWDADSATWTDEEMDWTKPVDPSLASTLFDGGISAAAAIAMYDGSAGGTGFDLAESGYDWIQYVKVAGLGENYGADIDGFADVAPIPEPATISMLVLGAVAMLRRRRGV